MTMRRHGRWINCLLIREVPFKLANRLWDTYLAEGGRLKGFLLYVAAAFLLSWSGPLRTMDFQVRRRARRTKLFLSMCQGGCLRYSYQRAKLWYV